MNFAAPPAPAARLAIGVTGHRTANAAFKANRDHIAAVLDQVLDAIAAAAASEGAPVRLHCLLADGVDQMAARSAVSRNWELVAPLPFGFALNVAVNAAPGTAADAEALLAGRDAADPATQARAVAIQDCAASARLFELADRDPLLTRLYLEKLRAPADLFAAQAFAARSSARVALAGRVMIEQSDIIIGLWDGRSRAFVGGTGHTISEALEHGAPVIWINANAPEDWQILCAPEALVAPGAVDRANREAELMLRVRSALRPEDADGEAGLENEVWRPHSNRWWAGYRRVEALFSGDPRPFRSLVQTYEAPDAISSGTGAAILAAARALPGGDPVFVDRIEADVLRRFAWADGVSAWLSDAYRGGMTANFVLSALAVVGGIAYQPLASSDQKWMFASLEFVLLATILLITWLGGKWRWHGRWFETRRVAEYLRHAPILLLLGIARAPGRWPQGGDVTWPEFHARQALRASGLPQVAITPTYLRHSLTSLLDHHVVAQRDYHEAKAKRLSAVHHNLDVFSTRLFQ